MAVRLPGYPPAPIGLKTGLACIVAALIAMGAALLGGWLDLAEPKAAHGSDNPASIAQMLPDPQSLDFMFRFQGLAPLTADAFKREAEGMLRRDADSQQVANLLLRAILAELRRSALYIQTAPTADYDRLLDHLRTGLRRLTNAQSPWCEATAIEALLKQSEPQLVTTLLAQFPYDGEAYQWLLDWTSIYLEAAEHGRTRPAARLTRSAQDKMVLQQQGIALGSRQWGLALKIAAFSQAEGQGYAPMRDVISQIDVCELGIAIVDLSDSLPEVNRGRIWAELLPEIFHGNTPYVLSVVTDYFFLS